MATTKMVTLRVEPDTLAQLNAKAARLGMTRSALLILGALDYQPAPLAQAVPVSRRPLERREVEPIPKAKGSKR